MSEPVFPKDKVNAARDHLVRLFRVVFYAFKITPDRFVDLFSEWAARFNKPKPKVAVDRSNLRRRLIGESAHLTWKTFYNSILMGVLNTDVIRLSVTLRDRRTGLYHTYASDMKATDDGVMDPVTGRMARPSAVDQGSLPVDPVETPTDVPTSTSPIQFVRKPRKLDNIIP